MAILVEYSISPAGGGGTEEIYTFDDGTIVVKAYGLVCQYHSLEEYWDEVDGESSTPLVHIEPDGGPGTFRATVVE